MGDPALDTRAGETETAERERMAALGMLAAGLAHELKNPAIAIGRSVDLLRREVAGVDPILRQIASHPWSEDELRFLARLGATTERAQSSTAAIDRIPGASSSSVSGCGWRARIAWSCRSARCTLLGCCSHSLSSVRATNRFSGSQRSNS